MLLFLMYLFSSVFSLTCYQSIQVQIGAGIGKCKDNDMDPHEEMDANTHLHRHAAFRFGNGSEDQIQDQVNAITDQAGQGQTLKLLIGILPCRSAHRLSCSNYRCKNRSCRYVYSYLPQDYL